MHATLHGDAKSHDEVDVTELAKNLATEGHLSFAFMNLNEDSNKEKEEGGRALRTRWDELCAFVDHIPRTNSARDSHPRSRYHRYGKHL